MNTNAAIKIKCKARRKAELLCLKTVFLKTMCLKALGESLQNTGKSQGRKALHEAAGPSPITGSQIPSPACTPRAPARACPGKAFFKPRTSAGITYTENWRKGWDSNPRYPCRHAGFQDRCLKPLGHPSKPLILLPNAVSSRCQRRPFRLSAITRFVAGIAAIRTAMIAGMSFRHLKNVRRSSTMK